MRANLRQVVWRLAIFLTVCLLGMFTMFAVFAELRFQPTQSYHAEFRNVSGLESGNFVRIAGVEVGKVTEITLQPDATLAVEFTTDDSVVLTRGSRAVIRYDDLIGGRYLGLEEGPGEIERLQPGGTIGLDQTAPALDLDALIGGFRPLFRALDPDQVNALSGQLVRAFQGQGPTIGSLLTHTAALTNTLADRDELIGEVIDNLHTVLGSFADQSEQFDTGISALSELVDGLEARKTDISTAVGHADSAASSIADLLDRARPPLTKVIAETDRTAGLVVADHDYVDNLLDTLPEAYQALGRQGLYGDFFSFYLCDAVLKLNGKGGQPVFVKMAGQTTGRCAPK
jgi:phospholipid/cholesterol/gamma-HCH transport system substrate-binding protein